MSWDAMLEAESRVNNPVAAFEAWREIRIYGHLRYVENAKRSYLAGVAWVIGNHGRAVWESLDERSALIELRKGEASMFHPVFAEDPVIWADCPRDGRVTITAAGECDRCHFDFLR